MSKPISKIQKFTDFSSEDDITAETDDLETQDLDAALNEANGGETETNLLEDANKDEMEEEDLLI